MKLVGMYVKIITLKLQNYQHTCKDSLVVAVHPAYDIGFDQFAPSEVHNSPKSKTRVGC